MKRPLKSLIATLLVLFQVGAAVRVDGALRDVGTWPAPSTPSRSAHYTYGASGLPVQAKVGNGTRDLSRKSTTFPGGAYAIEAGGTTYVFDAQARLIRKGDISLSYGPDGHLSAAEKNGRGWQFVHDEDGHRVLKLAGGVPYLGWVEGSTLTEQGMVDPVHVCGQLVGLVRQGVFEPLATDARGSLLADSTGATFEITPYGVRDARPAIAEILDYVEKGYDPDLGFVRMGVRDYDPSIDQLGAVAPRSRFLHRGGDGEDVDIFPT